MAVIKMAKLFLQNTSENTLPFILEYRRYSFKLNLPPQLVHPARSSAASLLRSERLSRLNTPSALVNKVKLPLISTALPRFPPLVNSGVTLDESGGGYL